ncbi:MAG: hypothetical protein LBI67_10880, partial [Treponema sp.]|nr:hypothetical protein [Treponema sp.]
IRFDFDEIQKILRARPPNLFLHYDVRLPDNPVTLEFDEDTTLKIPYDFFLEIPLDFRIFADTPQGEYATIQFLDMAGTGDDVFNRKSVYEPLMSGAMDLQRLFVTVDYENNLGYNGLEADLVSMNGSTENFRQPLGMLSEGAGNLSTVLDAAAVPWPFVAGLEIRLPADKVEGVEKYAHFQIKRGGGIKAGLRISAEGSAEFHL